ncbi:MAG: hypothetical protein DRP47_00855 [Candidatus Zixiibacteriota bacterium]|nr:MAG: hypothetical protein DRP47_00855 [candidate division Zixibacteria bacterium]
MLDKKSLPLIILLIAVILFYYPILEFLGLNPPPEPAPQTEQTQGSADSLQPIEKPTTGQPTQPLTDTAKPAQILEQDISLDTTAVDSVIISTNKYTAILSSLGGGPVSIKLKEHYYRNGEEIEMLPEADHATPDAVFAGGTFSTSIMHCSCNLTPGSYDATRDTLEIIYEYLSPDSGLIRKRYHFYPDSYHFSLNIEVEQREKLGFERQYSLVWNTPLGTTEPQMKRDYNSFEAVAMQSGSREALDDFKDDTLSQSLDGYTTWVGVRSLYFTAIIIPQGRQADLAFANGSKRKVSTPEGRIEQRKITAGLVMPFASVSSFSDSFTVYVGPMDYMLMWDYDVDLEAMLNIGTFPFFGMILKPFAIAILWLLPIMYDIIPNYGLVIILFALLVKIITLPLSMKQFKSMQAMKELAPHIEELKKQHKKNPQALQKETMKLYKTHGVNPMSGCLVMLPQMPLMIAMFRVFQATVLLRAAPFVGFVDDLSRGASGFTDPYIILVILMVGTQFISSKLTMASGQQQQKALMYMMPLMMGFLLYSLPSGLILYWTIFSLMSLLDWFLFKRNKIKNVEVKTA